MNEARLGVCLRAETSVLLGTPLEAILVSCLEADSVAAYLSTHTDSEAPAGTAESYCLATSAYICTWFLFSW